MPYEFAEILETIKMTEIEHFDIRTVTMGISLRNCVDRNVLVTAQKIYEKLMRFGSKHVENAREIEQQYGISIANKRISVTPIAIIGDAFGVDEFLRLAETLDKAATNIGIDYIAGFSALVQKGFTGGDLALIQAIPQALASTKKVCSSVNIGSTKAGININAINRMASVIKETAKLTADRQSIGCAKLVVFCNAVEDNPFVAGAFHGISEPEVTLNVGISGPGVVLDAVRSDHGTARALLLREKYPELLLMGSHYVVFFLIKSLRCRVMLIISYANIKGIPIGKKGMDFAFSR